MFNVERAMPQLSYRMDQYAGMDRSLFDRVQKALPSPNTKNMNLQKLRDACELIMGNAPKGISLGNFSCQWVKFGPNFRAALLWTSYREGYPYHPTTIAMIGGPSISPMFSFPRGRLALNEAGCLRIPHFLGVLAACGDDELELRHFISVSYMDLGFVDADPEKTALAQKCKLDTFEGIKVTNPRSPQYHAPANKESAVWAQSALQGHHEFVLCHSLLNGADEVFWTDPNGSLGPLRSRVEPRLPYVVEPESGNGTNDDGSHWGFTRTKFSDGTVRETGGEVFDDDDDE